MACTSQFSVGKVLSKLCRCTSSSEPSLVSYAEVPNYHDMAHIKIDYGVKNIQNIHVPQKTFEIVLNYFINQIKLSAFSSLSCGRFCENMLYFYCKMTLYT